jgi:hypothetical protein
MLIKSKVSKSTVSLLEYLRDRLPGGGNELEWEVAEINKRLSGRKEKKRKAEIEDYQFNDPFKPNVENYNRAEYNKYAKGQAPAQQRQQVSDRSNFGIGERERNPYSAGNFGYGRKTAQQAQAQQAQAVRQNLMIAKWLWKLWPTAD